MSRPVIDVSELPPLGFGHRSIVWWATMGIIAIEGTMFALMFTTYLYLKGRSPHWPPGFFPPGLLWGSVNTVVMLASAIPNQLTKKAAERFDLRGARMWLTVCLVFGLAFNVIRIFEFQTLNVWWDSNAYGSVTWTLLGLHTTHIVTDFADSIVLAAILYKGPVKLSHLVDVSENAFYWYFVILSWLPIYGLIYWAPRLS
jgi:cytochrome c oxidase subunit 1/cytochrome c oxidase subunit I+III